MISNIAREIYSESIQLKKYRQTDLVFRSGRLALLEELNAIQRKVESLLLIASEDSAFSDAHRKVAVLME